MLPLPAFSWWRGYPFNNPGGAFVLWYYLMLTRGDVLSEPNEPGRWRLDRPDWFWQPDYWAAPIETTP